MKTEQTQNGTGRVQIRDVHGTDDELSHIAGAINLSAGEGSLDGMLVHCSPAG